MVLGVSVLLLFAVKALMAAGLALVVGSTLLYTVMRGRRSPAVESAMFAGTIALIVGLLAAFPLSGAGETPESAVAKLIDKYAGNITATNVTATYGDGLLKVEDSNGTYAVVAEIVVPLSDAAELEKVLGELRIGLTGPEEAEVLGGPAAVLCSIEDCRIYVLVAVASGPGEYRYTVPGNLPGSARLASIKAWRLGGVKYLPSP